MVYDVTCQCIGSLVDRVAPDGAQSLSVTETSASWFDLEMSHTVARLAIGRLI